MYAWSKINAKYDRPLTQGELPAPPTFTPITSKLGRTLCCQTSGRVFAPLRLT